MSSRLTEKGEHGATATLSMAKRPRSWWASITLCVSAMIAGSSSTRLSGGSPPWLRPTLMLPRAAWNRIPISAAGSMLSSRRHPFGKR